MAQGGWGMGHGAKAGSEEGICEVLSGVSAALPSTFDIWAVQGVLGAERVVLLPEGQQLRQNKPWRTAAPTCPCP